MDISGWIERWADAAPDRVAIRFEDAEISYGALRDRIRAAAAALGARYGVRPGDRIGFLGYNSPEFIVLLFACARSGAIMVPLNWRLAPPEHKFILDDAGVSVLFAEPEFFDHIDRIREELSCRHFIASGEGRVGWDAFAPSPGANPDSIAGPDDPLLIVYTSGTTGTPKGAVLNQNALGHNALNSVAAHDMKSSDVVLVGLPMFHVGGMNILATPALYAGATVILQRRFDPDATVSAINEARPTLLTLVPAMLQAILDHPDWPTLDLGCLRCLDTGSTTVPLPLLRAFLDRGVPVIQVYGSTETAPIAIHQRIDEAWSTAGSTGKPALHCEARIVGPNGDELPPGEKGEIVVRGANVMTGYWNNPGATAEVMRDGWFHTGDVGHADADGNFYVDDRIKDVIISGSENIYPAELENVLDGCVEIAEAAVIGRSDARWGEVPVAVVVRRAGADIDRDGVLALFDDRLARYKRPRDVVFVDALPRNVMGKILKFEIRARLDTGRGGP